MVDSKNIKELCCYYDDIVHYTYNDSDIITNQLINYYCDYVLKNINNDEEHEKIKKIDFILNEYINNYKFYSFFQIEFKELYDESNLEDLVIKIYDKFKENQIKKVTNTKWL